RGTGGGSGLAGSPKRLRNGVLSRELTDAHAKNRRLSTKSGGYEQFWHQKTEQTQPLGTTPQKQTTSLVKQ
ncbi:MAG: hypothetical protein J6P73_01125, partial [Bacteroidales bacterium]|nr:hypothetical protein [Bacteroidales bacterium]